MHLKKKTVAFVPAVPDFEILYQRARYIILEGGRGGGKSHAAAEALIYYAMKYARLRILCLRSVQRSLAESAYRLLALKMEVLGVAHLFHKTKEGFIHKKNKSQFIFAGISSQPEKIKSMEGIHIAWVEEAQTVTHPELELLLPTVRAPGSMIIFTMNRRYPTDAVAEIFLENEPPAHTLHVHVDYGKNPLCPQEQVLEAEAMKKSNYELYLHIWKGQYRQRGTKKLFALDLVHSAMGRPTELDRDAPIQAGLDVAREGDDDSFLVVLQGLRVLHLQKWHEPDSKLLAQAVAGVVIDLGITHLNVDAVGVGGPVADMLRHQIGHICAVFEYKSNFTPHPKYVKYCGNRRAQSYKVAHDFLKVCHIPQQDPLARRLRDDLLNIEYDHDVSSRIIIPPKKRLKAKGLPSPDAADAFAMAIDMPKIVAHALNPWAGKAKGTSPLAPPPGVTTKTKKTQTRLPRPEPAAG